MQKRVIISLIYLRTKTNSTFSLRSDAGSSDAA